MSLEPEFIDMTGKPRSDRELEEAIKVVSKFIVTGILSLPPELGIQLTVIRGLLLELQGIRSLLARARKDREAKPPREHSVDADISEV